MNFFEELLWRAPVTVVTAVVSASVYFAFFQWLNYLLHRKIRRRLRRQIEVYTTKHGRLEVALVLSVLNDIRQSVQDYLEGQGHKGILIYQVHQKEGFEPKEEKWEGYLEQVKKRIRQIRELGATRIHLFCALPVGMATLAGATLTNGPEVVVYQYRGPTYDPIGRLTIETVRL